MPRLEIVSGYQRGTRHQIHADDDGLLAAGEPGVQLTWMDAKVGDWVVTPRIGKPVEIQALWLNSLWLTGRHAPEFAKLFDDALPTFRRLFWNESLGWLLNDVSMSATRVDSSMPACVPTKSCSRGLPYVLLDGRRARSIVDTVEKMLWTPLGLRTLSPDDQRYQGKFEVAFANVMALIIKVPHGLGY